MGMFDRVLFSMPCPRCGNVVSDFQTKDLDCTLTLVVPWKPGIRSFYSSCPCGRFIQFLDGELIKEEGDRA